MENYSNLTINVSSAPDGKLRIRATSDQGEAKTLIAPFEVEKLAQATKGVMRSSRAIGTISSGTKTQNTDDSAKDLGYALYNALFQGKIGNMLSRTDATAKERVEDTGVSIRLVFDLEDKIVSEFARLPWELMRADRNAGTPLSISTETAMVRCIDAIRPVSLKKFVGPLKVLLIKSKPTDAAALNVDRESRGIVEILEGLEGVEVTEVAPVKGEILKELKEKQYHILHYMGHGDFDGTGGALLLEEADGSTDKVSSAEFTGWLSGNRHLRLVFLNACNSGTTGDDISLDPYAGVATALMSDGLPAVVAMQFPISDQSAIDFSKTFYQRISRGEPLESAVAEGRKALWQTEGSEWATPVLYLRAKDGYLFGRKEKSTKTASVALPWFKKRRYLSAISGVLVLLVMVITITIRADNERADTIRAENERNDEQDRKIEDKRNLAAENMFSEYQAFDTLKVRKYLEGTIELDQSEIDPIYKHFRRLISGISISPPRLQEKYIVQRYTEGRLKFWGKSFYDLGQDISHPRSDDFTVSERKKFGALGASLLFLSGQEQLVKKVEIDHQAAPSNSIPIQRRESEGVEEVKDLPESREPALILSDSSALEPTKGSLEPTKGALEPTKGVTEEELEIQKCKDNIADRYTPNEKAAADIRCSELFSEKSKAFKEVTGGASDR